jgi:GDP-4-dehydro-6-deoxy-D-mannose reductase
MIKRKNKKRTLMTGIAGFAGSYLAEFLLRKGFEIYGLLAPTEKIDNIKHIKNDLRLEQFDIIKQDKVSKFIRKVKPEYIYHLAAFSSVGKSFGNEKLTYDINFYGTLNLYEAAREIEKSLKKILFVSSPDIYGLFEPKGKTLNEKQPFNPVSPYAISKIAAEHLSQYYYNYHSLPIVRVRPFNHTGPRQSDTFAIPSFCKQIAAIEDEQQEPKMSVGDLSNQRDLSDVRDIIRGYYLLAQKARPGEVFHLCSGRTVSFRFVLDKLRGMTKTDINEIADNNRKRKLDIPILRGTYKKAAEAVGWYPKYKLEQTLKDTLQYWRKRITK